MFYVRHQELETAERIILELKDRIDKDIIIEEDNISDLNYDNYMEAINGLMSLGIYKNRS